MSDIHLSGSCLCGSVAYEIDGEMLYFNHCHCQRCRKATGTGHATNIIMKPSTATWTAGEHLLRHYRLPEAERFATTFCSECGSLMPRIASDNSFALVPAGTLDEDPGVSPERHIFQGSRASWSCKAHDLPAFATYP